MNDIVIVVLRLAIMIWNINVPFIGLELCYIMLCIKEKYEMEKYKEGETAIRNAFQTVIDMNAAALQASITSVPSGAAVA
jgi:hypothetical protein